MTAASTVPVSEPAGGDQSHADGEQGDCRCDHALDGGAGMGEPGPVAVPVVGVADHFGVGADEPAVDRDRVIGSDVSSLPSNGSGSETTHSTSGVPVTVARSV